MGKCSNIGVRGDFSISLGEKSANLVSMSKLNSRWLWLLLLFGSICLLSLRSVALKPFVIDQGGVTTTMEFVRTYNAGQLNIEANYYHQWYKPTKVILEFSGCLAEVNINGEAVDLNTSSAQLCGQRKLYMDLSGYLNPGLNRFNFKLFNYQGIGSLMVYNDAANDLVYCLLVLSVIVSLCGLMVLIFHKLKFNRVIIVILISGFLLRAFYLNYTAYNERAYDVDGHIDFVQAIARTGSLPKADMCWQCYQPPLYYVFAGTTYNAAVGLTNFSPIPVLQYFSLMTNMAFLAVGVLLIKKLLNKEELVNFAALVFVFWPGGIINSVRITNDILLYLLLTTSVYFVVKWWQSKSHSLKFLWWGVAFAVLSLWTKNTGLVCAVIIAILLLLKFIKHRNWKWFSIGLLTAIILLFGWGATYLNRIFNPPNYSMDILIGNIEGNDSTIDVRNELRNFIEFNPEIYFSQAFTSPREDSKGRQYVSNYVIKTSLFGEFEYPGKLAWTVGLLISLTALIMIVVTVVQGVYAIINHDKKQMLVLLIGGVLMGSLLAVRLRFPTSATMDFRFIVPFLIPLSILFAASISRFEKLRIKGFKYISYALGVVLAVLSTVFFLLAVPLGL